MMIGYGPKWGMMGDWGSYGYGPLHFVTWIIVLIAFMALVVWLLRSFGGRGIRYAPLRRSPGLDMLEERYARGEINRDEYLQKKRDMDGQS